MKNFTRRSTIAGVATLALVGTGIAFAAWTSTGTGSGTADATSAVDLTVNVGDASGLYPTGSKTATFTVTNPNPYAVKLTGADAATNFGVDSGHSGCNLTSLSSAAQSLTDVIRRRRHERFAHRHHLDGQHRQRRLPGCELHVRPDGPRRIELTLAQPSADRV